MFRTFAPLLLLACQVEDPTTSETCEAGALPSAPPPPFTLAAPDWVIAGQPLTLGVSTLPPLPLPVNFAATRATAGAPYCPAALGGCYTLSSPGVTLGARTVTGSGSLTVTVPSATPPGPLHTQAAVRAGRTLVISNVETTQVLDRNGDVDRDGLPNHAEASRGSNPLVADTDGGGEDDGDEAARGADPLDPADDACQVTVHHGDYLVASDADLAGLRCIAEITGGLTIQGSVTTLSPLHALTRVGSNLNIQHNPALGSLSGLEALTTVGSNLDIRGNPALETLSGLGALTRVGIALFVADNAALVSPSGLDVFTSAGNIFFDNNPSLTTLSGLDALTSAVNVGISNNPALASLSGLEHLTSVLYNVSIFHNEALTALSGLDALAEVGGDLIVADNPGLRTLSGLEALGAVGGGLYLYDNHGLCQAEVDAMDARLAASCTSCGGQLPSRVITGDFLAASDAAVASLRCVREVTGSLTVRGSATTLRDLATLTTVGLDLAIFENPALTTLSGLDAVATVGGALDVHTNNGLRTLSGLQSVHTVGRDLIVRNSPGLTTLSGLDAVTSVGIALRVRDNPALTTLSGLDALTSIAANLDVYNNPALLTLSGLDALTSVGGLVNVYNNPRLCQYEVDALDARLTAVCGVCSGNQLCP